MSDRLTDKQRRFVLAYLEDPNGTRAAIKAGYAPASAEVEAVRQLRNAKVKYAIERHQRAREERTLINADRVLNELAILAFSDIGEFVEWNESEVKLKDSSKIDINRRRAVIEVTQTKDGAIKIKLADKKGPLELLTRHVNVCQGKADGELSGTVTLKWDTGDTGDNDKEQSDDDDP